MTRRGALATGTLAVAAALLLALPAVALGFPKLPSKDFKSSVSGCGCHAANTEAWSLSMHAKAISDPIYQFKVREAVAATKGQLGPFCTSCHSPVGVMSGEITGPNLSKASEVAKEGVSCDFCHQVDAVTASPPGNASLGVIINGKRRGPITDPKAPHGAEYNKYFNRPEYCGSCHNVNHPVNGMHLESTYTEWKNSKYATDGVTCQDCHMTPGPGNTSPYAGSVGGGAAERASIYVMSFAGGNVGLGDASRATENLKAAARMTVEAPEVVDAGRTFVATCTIQNVGAGHYLPTGLTEVRQMWLELKATDKTGAVVSQKKRVFETVFKDKDGNTPAEVWEAVGIAKDDRIPPSGYATETLEMPMSNTGPVQVSAALYYRSCSPELAASSNATIPTTLMTSARTVTYRSQKERAEATGGTVSTSKEQSQISDPMLPMWIAVGGILGVIGVFVVYGFASRKRRVG